MNSYSSFIFIIPRTKPKHHLYNIIIPSNVKSTEVTSKKHKPRSKSKHINPETEPGNANKKITQSQFGRLTR